ncbi:MAG: glutathione S-transferase C-terminal domain-containing protein [bacterium]|nr:glutathione S-transferase C-terminal domain-containing protein [bacterium]
MASDGLWRYYGAEISYFTGKVRPAFRMKRVPHLEVLSDAEVYRTVIRPRVGFDMIPVAVTPEDETVQDSSDILDALERRYPEPVLLPPTPLQRIAAHLVELYTDEFLLLPGIHWRWNYEESAAKARHDFVAIMGDPGALRFADAVKAFCLVAGVVPETIPAIETHVHALLALLEEHLAEHRWLLGAAPTLADCAMMGPFYAHFYLDAASGTLLRTTAPRTCHWIERTNHPDPAGFGPLAADDALPGGMRALLGMIGRDAMPMILDCVRAVDAAIDEGSYEIGREIPRVVGMHRGTVCGVAVDRVTLPYTLWMVQRVRGAWEALGDADRARVDRALAGTGCEALFAHVPRHRVERRPFKLHLAS